MGRPRHPRAELELVLRAAEAGGWRVERRAKYYRLRCPCPEQHARSVHLTPSDRNHRRNLVGWLGRCACWRGAGS